MEGNTIPVNENTTIIVKSSGDLFLQGQEQNEVRFQGSEDRIRVQQSADTLYVETHASLDIEVPQGANVVVEKVGGSAFIEDLGNSLVVQKVGGDLAMQRLTKVQVDKVGGNCLVADVSSDLVIGKVGGDLTARQVAGRMEAGHVGGDCDLQSQGDGPVEARTGGDMRVYVTEIVGDGMTLRAGGDMSIYLPANTNANLVFNANSESIDLNFSRQAQPFIQSIEERHFELMLGEGGPRIEAQTGGDMHASDEAVDPSSISGELERRENAWIEARERHGSPSWSAGFGFDRTSAWADMVSRRAQEAARRAEQRANAASRRAEEHIRQAAERGVRQTWDRDFNFNPPFSHPGHGEHAGHGQRPAPEAPQRVTEQERLMVLQMLQENKISVEQAEKLLAALEGRYNA